MWESANFSILNSLFTISVSPLSRPPGHSGDYPQSSSASSSEGCSGDCPAGNPESCMVCCLVGCEASYPERNSASCSVSCRESCSTDCSTGCSADCPEKRRAENPESSLPSCLADSLENCLEGCSVESLPGSPCRPTHQLRPQATSSARPYGRLGLGLELVPVLLARSRRLARGAAHHSRPASGPSPSAR